MKKISLAAIILLLAGILIFSACAAAPPKTFTETGTSSKPAYTSPASTTSQYHPSTYPKSTSTTTIKTTTATTSRPTTTSGTIGLSTGGAKDITNFRENIRNNYLPMPTDITYEGLFYDYYFETGQSEPSQKLFSPSYSYAVTRDPISHQTEYYLSVGLNSGLKESDFERKKLNLVIVLDNSGSMGETFDRYYYDQIGKPGLSGNSSESWEMKKIDSAKQSVLAILDQLRYDDRLAIVTFNSNAYLQKPMDWLNQSNIRDLRNQIMNIQAGGSTNLSAGMNMATGLFKGLRELNSYEYENRIIILTDAQPNTGDINSYNLAQDIRRNADSRIYSTFIGIGVDFNSQLIEEITKTKGANYYSVHSPGEFKQRMEDEFEYMVTPLVFNVQLNFYSRGWVIEKVFGSPEADQSSGRLMTINTLFPSKSEGGETRGGIVILKLRKTSSSPGENVFLRVSYEDRNGQTDGAEEAVNLENWAPEAFENTGIRKAILLSRYAALLKNWMADERNHIQYHQSWNPCVREDTGIVIPVESNFSQWERQSLPLTVTDPYRQIFRNFTVYFENEMRAVNDYDLDQEVQILKYLSR
jgi:Ca-activated chloride channel family protein